MIRNRGLLLGVAAVVVGTVMTPPAHAATWVSTNCTASGPSALSSWKRSNAQTYSLVADNEGYQWGGGCYNDNNRDDSPNHPQQDTSTMGEGTDCSGLVFKTWALKTTNVGGFAYWNKLKYQHGPNGSVHYRDAKWSGGATAVEYHNISKSRTYTNRMDAFARNGHIGLIYTDDGTSDGQDHIIESASEASGTDINIRNYRSVTDYKAVARYGWYPESTCASCS